VDNVQKVCYLLDDFFNGPKEQAPTCQFYSDENNKNNRQVHHNLQVATNKKEALK
jgi:hypothetical protein